MIKKHFKKFNILIIIFLISIPLIKNNISIVACQPAKQEVTEKKEQAMEKEIPKVETTGEAVVDAVGNDLNNDKIINKE